MKEKRKWAKKMLQMWGSFAKLAYIEQTPVGLIQYRPVPAEKVIYVYCIYVPEKEQWQKGIATQLLFHLIEDAKKSRFDNEPPLALVTKTFPVEDGYPARLFFTRRGFNRMEKFLYHPLKEDFVYRSVEKIMECIPQEDLSLIETFTDGIQKEIKYIPQKEDVGKVLIIYGPSFCPFSCVFLKKSEQIIKEIAPEIPVRWMSKSDEPMETEKRGNAEGCIVNAKLIRSSVFDRENVQKEVAEALKEL